MLEKRKNSGRTCEKQYRKTDELCGKKESVSERGRERGRESLSEK